MSQKPRRMFTPEQKASAVAIVKQSGKLVSQVAQEMDLTESGLRKWVKQAAIDQGMGGSQAFTTQERAELTALRKELKRVQME